MVNWGIISTGDNATKFAKDLLIDPSTRGVQDVTHNLAAVASSTSQQKAQDFLSAVNAPPNTVAYGSYESLLADNNVEIVYISTPHSHHFQNARAGLLAGKHVLLEKAFTVNAAQARILAQLAREKNLFLMEAMWTRFFPLMRYVRQLLKDGAIGVVQRVVADRNLGRDVEKLYGTEHRLVNPGLAGGALLDLAIYPLTWIFQILYHDGPVASGTVRSRPHISSSVVKYTATGVDETATIIVTFPESQTQGVATASLRVTSDPTDPGVRILGDKGQIQIFGPAARPLSIALVAYGDEGPKLVERKDFEIPVGHGLFWEADACAQYLVEGKTESDLMPLEETLLIMEVMDRVREENGIKYPDEVEAH
ncbi:dimeric dihydrodiol dehydrogenase [Aspergillus bombycis]|uniref:D-xylose 1-dehydrogenase (NADP(+), D-xylono-1,5-lactone-forming) n=1 Tax=Aspergillus bombycis TaxID=109264 RepID=A0A1F8A818_9EURO|nr:dimeric dihydrodiol dehydrogenase [Aspergillus bombycis]OGM47864.1 dimeric dihydrodiol dehydrogenase [Aspergillus bombycis]